MGRRALESLSRHFFMSHKKANFWRDTGSECGNMLSKEVIS